MLRQAGDGPDQDVQPRLRRAHRRARRRPLRGRRPTGRITTRSCSHEPALKHLPEAIRHTEEPKVNSLQLYLLHRFIGEHVKVALSGLGGDELFAGYDIYGYLARTERLRQGRAATALRAAAPVLDGIGRRGEALGQPQLDLAVRQVEWLASAGDPARHYLLLRNALGLQRRRSCKGCTRPTSSCG